MSKAIRFKNLRLFTGVALVALSFNTLDASANDRMDDLEGKLSQALQMLEKQSREVRALKKELTHVKRGGGSAGGGDINARLEEVENAVFELDDRVGSRAVVSAFDAQKLTIGGFLHSAYTHLDHDDGSATAFNRHAFELLMRADFNDDWSAFVALAYLREAGPSFNNGTGAAVDFRYPAQPGGTVTPQVIAWSNYQHSDAFQVKFGRMITPHGIINIEHFPATLLDTEQPQFLRPFGGDTMFSNFTTGIQFHGRFALGGDNAIQYNTYVSAKQGATENPIYGARLAYSHGNSGVTVGVNGATGERTEGVESEFTLWGADLKIDKGPILWKSEVFSTSEDVNDDRFAWYTQPAWRINDQWIAFYRYDFLDNGANTGDMIEQMLGVNFLPLQNIRLRATTTFKEFDGTSTIASKDARIHQLSATLSF